MSWDSLKLPSGWIAVSAGVLVVYATGLVMTGAPLWIIGVVDQLTGGNALLVVALALAGLALAGMDARHRRNARSREPREHSVDR